MRILPILLAATAFAPTPATADTLVTDVNGIQVDARGRIQHFAGLLIDNNGRVKRLLVKGAKFPPAAIRIDLHGATMLPGLIDAHGHIMELGLDLLALNVRGATSIGDLQSRLKAYAAANPGHGWIMGMGWNQELWADHRMPTSADLDAIVSDRPVWLVRVDSHAAVGNSAALKAAGITDRTLAPQGGRIEHGLFTDKARDQVEAHIPPPSDATLDAALATAQEAMLSTGLTGAADMGTSPEVWAAMRRAGDAGRLKLRIMSYALGVSTMNRLLTNGPTPWLYDGRLRMGGVKYFADGALGSRGAWLKAPYSDRPDTRGLPRLDQATLDAQVAMAAKLGLQVATHAIGDAANAMVITAYERARAAFPGDRRFRIEHVQIVDPADLPRIAKAHIIASMQPTHQTSDMNMAEARLGAARLQGAYAWYQIAASGAHLAFGSDFPIESPNPFPGLSAAISRSDPAGNPPGGWRPAERVSFAQAFAGFTREAAYAGFAETQIGSLDPGKWADFIIVDRDVGKVDAVSLAATKVRETWVAGKRAWSSAAAPPAR